MRTIPKAEADIFRFDTTKHLREAKSISLNISRDARLALKNLKSNSRKLSSLLLMKATLLVS